MSAVEPPIPPDEPELPVDPDAAMEGVEPVKSVDSAVAGNAPETVNLVETLSVEDQEKYAKRVVEDYERDMKSGEKFRERRARIVRLALGDIPPPKDGEKFRLARIHYAIIMTANTRISTRIYDQQFPSNGEYFGVKPTDADDLERAVRLSKHMNWQVQHQIPEYVPNHDVLINQTTLYGSGFSYFGWSPSKGRPCHEICATDDIIMPYFWMRGKHDPSLAEVPRITRILRYYRHELEDMRDDGYYANIDELFKKIDEGQSTAAGDETNTPQKMREVIDRNDGTEKQTDDPDAPRVVLEQHRWLKLPGSKKSRPVVCHVDLNSKTLLCLKIREDEDPQDKARFNREMKVNQASYEAAIAQWKMDMMAYFSGQSGTPAPLTGEMTQTAPPMPGETTAAGPPGMALPQQLPAPPQQPQPPPEPAPVKMVPINFFTHYICLPNPEGIYGLGIGSLLEGPNIAADTAASQFIDAATLANTTTGYRSRQAKIRGGEFRIVPGEIVETDLSPDEVKGGGGIHLLKFPEPSPGLLQMIKDQIEQGEKLSGAGDILSGEIGGSNMTATQAQIQISQALSQIAIINKRYTRSRTVEGQKLARLNAVYLDDKEYFYVVDPAKNAPPEEVHVGRADYLMDTDVTVTADPRMASQPQRLQEAVSAIEMVSKIPLLQGNAPLWFALIKDAFTAMDRPNLIAAMDQGLAAPMPPPGAPPPPGMPPGAGPGGPPENGAPSPAPGRPHPQPLPPKVPNSAATPANGPQVEGQAA